MSRITVIAMIYCLSLCHLAYAEFSSIYITTEYNGFYNYNHQTGMVIFYERMYYKKKTYYNVYQVDLKHKKVIKSIDLINDTASCIGFRPKISFNRDFLVSRKGEHINLLNLTTNECNKIPIEFDLISYDWTEDGKWLVLYDRDYESFHVLDPKTLKLKKYSYTEHANTMFWSPQLNTTLFSYTPNDYFPGDDVKYEIYYTTDENEYFYINKDNQWVKYKGKHPFRNPAGDVYFWQSDEEDRPNLTTFFDAKSNKKLGAFWYYSSRRYFSHVIWLDNGWVYLQGSPGLYNYRENKYVQIIPGEKYSYMSPFAVDQNRYAIMYDDVADRLKVYDLKEMKFIESYKPFWRKKR